MKKHLFTLLRLLIAAGGIAYIIWSLTWTDQPGGEPGILTMLRGADVPMLVLGLLVIGPVFPIQGLRWLLLLRACGINVTYHKAFRLVMVGSFFNYCMPGTTGGDVAKAYYAAKGSGRTTDAILSVVIDRVAGMLGLVIVGGAAGLFMLDNPIVHGLIDSIWIPIVRNMEIVILSAIVVTVTIIYFSKMLLRMLGVNWLLTRKPTEHIFERVSRAVSTYRDHKATLIGAIGLSILVHICIVVATVLAGKALGITHPTGFLVAVVPVLVLVMTIPISYQGLGVTEGFAKPLLVKAGFCTANQMVGMLMLYRLYMVAYSLLGSLFLLRGDIHLHPQQTEKTSDVVA